MHICLLPIARTVIINTAINHCSHPPFLGNSDAVLLSGLVRDGRAALYMQKHVRWSQQCAVFQETLPSRPFKLVLEKCLRQKGLRR